MTVKFLSPRVRIYLLEKFADHYVANATRDTLEKIVWDVIFEDAYDWHDDDIMFEIQCNCPEILNDITNIAGEYSA